MTGSLESQTYLLEMRLRREVVTSFDDYPFNIPAVRSLETLKLHPKVTFFVGDNGSGKSTLIEALAIALRLNPEGGSRNFSFATRESHSSLASAIRVVRTHRQPKDLYFFRSESFFNVATDVDRMAAEPSPLPNILQYYGERSLHEQSHGESFFALFNNRFFGNGLYLLDEPEAALSPKRQLSFIARMHQLIAKGSQFVISTHSPILLGYPEALIYQLGPDGIEAVRYEDTDHFTITKEFLNRRERMLKILLEE